MLRACENCGFESDDLSMVRRMYVTPETWDAPGSQQVLDDTEMWCVSCVTQYPNARVGDDADGGEAAAGA